MLKLNVRAALLSIAVFAAAFMVAMLVFTSAARGAPAGVQAIASEKQQAIGGYLVRAYNGHIAVFYGDITDSPAIETTIDVDTLRAVDRDKLIEGIRVENYNEVLRLLEDFGS